MAYELHIRRVGASGETLEIPLEQWQAAVARIDGVRLTSQDAVGRNPKSGVTVRIAAAPGDAEVLFPQTGWRRFFGAEGSWLRIFRWRRGQVAFKAAFDVNDPSDPVRCVAAALASSLAAEISGDDGESYDWSSVG